MIGNKQKRSVVQPLRERKSPDTTHLYPLALEIGELRRTTEKLMYRIQQCERREKELLTANRSLRRELSSLKKASSQSATQRTIRRPAKAPVQEPHYDPPNHNGSSEAPPDFGGALPELNSGRH